MVSGLVPVVQAAGEAGWALHQALAVVNDVLVGAGQVDGSTQVEVDAAPALELVGVRWAAVHAATLVVIILTGGTGGGAVWDAAATQALRVATLARVCTRPLTTALRTH